MKKILAILLFLLQFNILTSDAQFFKRDSTAGFLKNNVGLLTATLFIVGGSSIMLDTDADEFFLSNFEVREERNENFMTFSNRLDDYLQHTPSATAFLLSACHVHGKHDFANQTAVFVKSELLMLTIVYALKYSVGEARPDTGSKNSFPSGHTAQAFTAATFLSKEYGYKSLWISVGAYTVATTVGVFRVLNNRHWISDVLVGAGIGILSTEVIFRTHKNHWGRKKKNNLSIAPFNMYGAYGVFFCYKP